MKHCKHAQPHSNTFVEKSCFKGEDGEDILYNEVSIHDFRVLVLPCMIAILHAVLHCNTLTRF